MYGCTYRFFPFIKGDKFCNFLFASPDEKKNIQNGGALLFTLLQSERPKLHRVLAALSAIGLNKQKNLLTRKKIPS